MEFDKSQLMRGILEGCILKVISNKTTYGYEILEYLKHHGFSEIAEGTLYPLLLRLEKQGNIHSSLMPSPLGPRRKYFSITEQGKLYLRDFEVCWHTVSESVCRIMGGGDTDE